MTTNPQLPKLFAKQLAWQEAFTQLLVTSPKNHLMTSQFSNMALQDGDLDSANHNTADDKFGYYRSNGAVLGDNGDSAIDNSLQVRHMINYLILPL